MTELKVIDEREVLGKDFRIYGTAENPLFKADDVSKWIEHTNTSVMLNKIDEQEKFLLRVCTSSNAYSSWFITKKGLQQVLANSRKVKAKFLYEVIEGWKYKTLPEETEFGITLHKIFQGIVPYIEQYHVLQYKIDFYFPQINLAVEYDEEPHKYHAEEDKEREKNIKKVISCDFLRVTKANQLRAINKILRLHIKQIFVV